MKKKCVEICVLPALGWNNNDEYRIGYPNIEMNKDKHKSAFDWINLYNQGSVYHCAVIYLCHHLMDKAIKRNMYVVYV